MLRKLPNWCVNPVILLWDYLHVNIMFMSKTSSFNCGKFWFTIVKPPLTFFHTGSCNLISLNVISFFSAKKIWNILELILWEKLLPCIYLHTQQLGYSPLYLLSISQIIALLEINCWLKKKHKLMTYYLSYLAYAFIFP